MFVVLRNRELSFMLFIRENFTTTTERNYSVQMFRMITHERWKLNTFDVVSSSYPKPLCISSHCEMWFSDNITKFTYLKLNMEI